MLKEIPESSALLPGDGKALLAQGSFDFGIVSATGIALKDDVTEERWLELTESALKAYEYHGTGFARAALYVADLLNWGEEHLGERHAQAIDGTRAFLSRKEKTISNWRWIASKIPPSRRRENIDSLAIYEAVAKLAVEEQDAYLQIADEEALSVKELKAKIRESHPSTRTPKAKTEKEPALSIDNATDAKKAATQLSNWLTANEEKITDSWKPLLEHFHKLFRRRWQNGQKKK